MTNNTIETLRIEVAELKQEFEQFKMKLTVEIEGMFRKLIKKIEDM